MYFVVFFIPTGRLKRVKSTVCVYANIPVGVFVAGWGWREGCQGDESKLQGWGDTSDAIFNLLAFPTFSVETLRIK